MTPRISARVFGFIGTRTDLVGLIHEFSNSSIVTQDEVIPHVQRKFVHSIVLEVSALSCDVVKCAPALAAKDVITRFLRLSG